MGKKHSIIILPLALFLLASLHGAFAMGQMDDVTAQNPDAGKTWVIEKSYCAWFASRAADVKCGERVCVERDLTGTISESYTLYDSKAECDAALAGILSETAAQKPQQTDLTRAMAEFFGSIGRFFSSIWSR